MTCQTVQVIQPAQEGDLVQAARPARPAAAQRVEQVPPGDVRDGRRRPCGYIAAPEAADDGVGRNGPEQGRARHAFGAGAGEEVQIEGNVVESPQDGALQIGTQLAQPFVVGVPQPEREEVSVQGLEVIWQRCAGRRCHAEPADLDRADLPDLTTRIDTEQLESRLEAVIIPVVPNQEGLPRHGGDGPPADRQDSELHGSSGEHLGLRPGTSEQTTQPPRSSGAPPAESAGPCVPKGPGPRRRGVEGASKRRRLLAGVNSLDAGARVRLGCKREQEPPGGMGG